MVNIENIYIDQDTEYSVERLLTHAQKALGLGNFATAKEDDPQYLPLGFLPFIDRVIVLATEAQEHGANWSPGLTRDLNKVKNFRREQISFREENGGYRVYPANESGTIHDRLKKA